MEIVGKDVIRRAQAEAGHDVVVGYPLVAGKLSAAIGKVIETQRAVESQFIHAAVPPFHCVWAWQSEGVCRVYPCLSVPAQADELFQKIPRTVTRMPVIYFSKCPAAALVLCYENIPLPAICTAAKRHEFHIDLHIFSRIIRRRIGLAAVYFLFLVIPSSCSAHAMLFRIAAYPLTEVCYLCYLIHCREFLCGGW